MFVVMHDFWNFEIPLLRTKKVQRVGFRCGALDGSFGFAKNVVPYGLDCRGIASGVDQHDMGLVGDSVVVNGRG